jgi:dihydroorotase
LRALLLKALIGKELKELTLIIEDGIVSKRLLNTDEAICRNIECIDLREKGIALPGFIDLHAHLRGLELSYKEDEESGTKAAARGGFTGIVDMPNTKPKIDNTKSLNLKIKSLYEKAYVNFGISLTIGKDVDDFIEMLKAKEVVSVGELFPEEHERLPEILKSFVANGIEKPIIIHLEHKDALGECGKGKRWACRPIESEMLALKEIGYMLESARIKAKLHITHVTNKYVYEMAKKYKFTTDTCPHYLYLSSEDEEKFGCLAKVNPPLRTRDIAKELIGLLPHFDAISTDHAPHSIEEKSLPFEKCPSGIASIDIAVPLMINLVNKGILNLEDLIQLLSMGPQKILNMKPGWGCFDIGCKANYTVVDLDKEWKIDSSKFYTKARFSPYDGLIIKGDVSSTIINGTVVYLDGEIIERPKISYLK